MSTPCFWEAAQDCYAVRGRAAPLGTVGGWLTSGCLLAKGNLDKRCNPGKDCRVRDARRQTLRRPRALYQALDVLVERDIDRRRSALGRLLGWLRQQRSVPCSLAHCL